VYDSDTKVLDILLGLHELKLLKLPFLYILLTTSLKSSALICQYSICTLLGIQQYLYLVVIFHIDNLAHKLVHTLEKMDAINPTFELCKDRSSARRARGRL